MWYYSKGIIDLLHINGGRSMKKRILSFLFIFLIVFSLFPQALCAPDISVESDSAILFDVDQNSVLFEKEANKKMHPASITKVMTLLLAAENCNFDDKLTLVCSVCRPMRLLRISGRAKRSPSRICLWRHICVRRTTRRCSWHAE